MFLSKRHLEVFDAVAADPGYFLVVPVSLAVFGRRAEVDDCGDVIFVEQARIVHSSGLAARIKNTGAYDVEVLDVKMLNQQDGCDRNKQDGYKARSGFFFFTVQPAPRRLCGVIFRTE